LERNKIIDAMTQQLSSLTKSMELKKEADKPAKISDVALPVDVHQWRSSHVLAWISFKMELPQYVPNFKEASVDGLVLLKHVDDKTLQDSLGIAVVLHR
jgi:SAM domain (Sterile alpha motif)